MPRESPSHSQPICGARLFATLVTHVSTLGRLALIAPSAVNCAEPAHRSDELYAVNSTGFLQDGRCAPLDAGDGGRRRPPLRFGTGLAPISWAQWNRCLGNDGTAGRVRPG